MNKGVTIIELLVVLAVLGILLTIGLGVGRGYDLRAGDIERANDARQIAIELERSYRSQAASVGPSYPSTTDGSAAISSLVDDADIVIAPRQNSNSVKMATTTSSTPSMTKDEYVYQPFNALGDLCVSRPCVRFKLYYMQELDGNSIKTINSVRQQ